MSKNLALSLVGPRTSKNTATHGDRITVEFTNPPDEADDVEILIEDLSHTDRGGKHFAGTDLVSIRGRIRNGKFEHSAHHVLSDADPPRPKLHEMQVTFLAPDGTTSIRTRLPDDAKRDHMNLSHRLKWTCRGKVNGKPAEELGKATMRVFYKCAMIVPTGNAPSVRAPARPDPSLKLVARWAQQWESHAPDFRKKFPLTTVTVPARALTDADYAPLLKVVEDAAKFAENGIVALAVGHGDRGTSSGQSNPWCDIAAEDGVELDADGQITGVFHSLLVNRPELEEMPGVQVGPALRLPGADTMIKRNALDKMRGIFQQHAIRVLVLHTCTAGAAVDFTQLLSDRLQVHLRAHVLHITYQGFATGQVDSFYENDPVTPESAHEWPIVNLAFEVAPGAVPASPVPRSP
jgi:hypothetical protein